ncbi:MAG TPA: hypothetical protein EYG05_02460 [Candidatus Thioglobus autotrophicus]|jgi:hypothetical protein|nr:hypothetical protein [Candidatus Thioglobus autotrophicus]
MAIDQSGKVTTTGLMGGTPKLPDAPDMSGLGQGQETQGQAPAPIAERPAPEGAQDPNLDERIQNLNETEIAQLDGLLGPSNAAILKKIAPEASGIIDQFTSEEDVVSLPISAIKTYAMKIYGGDEKLAVQNFITDLSGQGPDNTNVPPENVQASNSNGMMAQEPNTQDTDAIDQGLV